MKKLLSAVAAAFVVALFSASLVQAKTFNIGGKSPIASIDFPGTWNVKSIDNGGIEASKGNAMFFWVETYTQATVAAVIGARDAHLESQGVTRDMSKTDKQDGDVHGAPAKVFTYDAKFRGRPTYVQTFIIDPQFKSGRAILITYWASPDAHERNQREHGAILDSFNITAMVDE